MNQNDINQNEKFSGKFLATQTTPFNEGIMAQWCNPLTLQAEQSGGVGSIIGRPQHLSAMTMGR